MRMQWGKRKDLNTLLKQHGFAPLIQTAFIERVNLTIRRGVAPLMRKTWSLAQTPTHLLLHLEWWRTYYHFIHPHESLSVPIPGLRRCRLRSPALAANLTNKLWSVEDNAQAASDTCPFVIIIHPGHSSQGDYVGFVGGSNRISDLGLCFLRVWIWFPGRWPSFHYIQGLF